MEKKLLKNRELQEIGDKVLKAVRLANDEIDRIALSPTTFDRIRAAIDTRNAKESSINRQPVSIWGWRPATALAAAGSVAVVLGLAEAITRVEKLSNDTANLSEQVRPVAVPDLTEPNLFIESSVKDDDPSGIRSHTRNLAPPRERRPLKRQILRKEIETVGEFQAVTYAGDHDEEGEQIVRVELPRASLYAMGIEVPVENDALNIKADLLIGADGVMRAVRVVKMD